MYSAGVPYQWQYTATRVGEVPDSVLRAAANVKIAVIDTGADLTAPDLPRKAPESYNVFNASTDVRDLHGYGTFVASIAGGRGRTERESPASAATRSCFSSSPAARTAPSATSTRPTPSST